MILRVKKEMKYYVKWKNFGGRVGRVGPRRPRRGAPIKLAIVAFSAALGS